MQADTVAIERNPDAATVNWQELHSILMDAFAFMQGRIDPPSSLLRMSPLDLERKARTETLILARSGKELVGCIFVRDEGGSVYVGKLAVAKDFRCKGVGKRLIKAAISLAKEQGAFGVELETRVELTENHQTFTKWGFVEVSRKAHDGFDRPTSVRMRLELD